jgi:hypothetical protein
MNKVLLSIALLFVFGFWRSQTNSDDAQLWLSLKLEKRITDHFGVFLNLKGRAVNNAMVPGRGAADLELFYKFSKNIKIQGGYVYVQKLRQNGTYRTLHQLRASVILKKDVRRWSFIYRNMLQARTRSFMEASDNYNFYYYDRNKLTLKYELNKRFSLYGAEEVYIPLNNPQVKGLSRSRSFLGTLMNVTKRQQLELYFMYQVQLQKGDWYKQDVSYANEPLARRFVYGLSYTIEF